MVSNTKYEKAATYHHLSVDGTKTDISGRPQADVFDWSFERFTICRLAKESVDSSTCDGNLLKWLKKNQSGIFVELMMRESRAQGENVWLAKRGLRGIFGDVVMSAVTYSEVFEDGNFDLPIKESLDIVEDVLGKRGKTLMDCVVHSMRTKEENERQMSSIRSCDMSGWTMEQMRIYLSPKGVDETIDSPDDVVAPLELRKVCVVCKKHVATIKNCPCGRAFYCQKECQLADWKVHKKYVHKGKFV